MGSYKFSQPLFWYRKFPSTFCGYLILQFFLNVGVCVKVEVSILDNKYQKIVVLDFGSAGRVGVVFVHLGVKLHHWQLLVPSG